MSAKSIGAEDLAQDDREISVGDLFDWFKADCASAEQEAEKLALIDEILRDDLLPAERPNLHKLKFAILAESPWLDPERAEAALDAFTAGFRECPSALRTFIRPG